MAFFCWGRSRPFHRVCDGEKIVKKVEEPFVARAFHGEQTPHWPESRQDGRGAGALLFLGNGAMGHAAELVVHIEGVASGAGQVLLFVRQTKDTYLTDDDTRDAAFRAYRFLALTPQVPRTVATLRIPAGHYAVNAYHDENGDGKLNRHLFPFFGMPSEPYGVAHGEWALFSKPSFEKALVQVEEPRTPIAITLSHHLSKITGGSGDRTKRLDTHEAIFY